jgi:hypothetical protein
MSDRRSEYSFEALVAEDLISLSCAVMTASGVILPYSKAISHLSAVPRPFPTGRNAGIAAGLTLLTQD